MQVKKTTFFTLIAFFCLCIGLFAPHLFAEEGARGNGNCMQKVRNGDETVFIGGLGSRSYLGVELTSLTPELRRHFGAPEGSGVMVSRVDDESPALAAGLQVGDILTHIEGQPVASAGEIGRIVRGHEGGDTVQIEYLRKDAAGSTTAVLGQRERCAMDLSQMIPEGIHVEGLKALEAIDWEQIGLVSGEAVEQAMEAARAAMESQDWEGMAEKWEEWAENSAAEWEEWGEKFGEEFGEKFGEEWSEEYMEKLETRMEELEVQLEKMEIEMEENFDIDIDPDTNWQEERQNI